ncbi:hypothetical protein Tco_0140904 [Tanacetum coccineum]
MYLSFHHEFISMEHEHKVLNLDSTGTRLQRRHFYLKINVSDKQQIQFKRMSLTGFPAQSVRSSNAIALDSLYLLVLITGVSQSRQHVDTSLIHIESHKPPTKSLFDVDSSRISIVIVNTKEHHSDVLAVITRIMGFPAQSVRSSNAISLDSMYLLILITGASQSRQHVETRLIHIESRKPPTKSLFDVDSSGISIVIVNTKEHHSDVLAVITRIMRRTL